MEQEVHNGECSCIHATEAPNKYGDTKRGISMKQDAFDNSNIVEEETRISFQGAPIEHASPDSFFINTAYISLSIEALVAQCSREINNYRKGEPGTDEYSLELLRRAIVQEDKEAWAGMQHCFSGLVRGWLHRHPNRDVASLVDSEENYISQTFECFRQATALTKHVEFVTFASAMRYLYASLNGVILDMLRAYARPREVTLPETGEAVELQLEGTSVRCEMWEALQAMLSDEREKRLAYLLFNCKLKPGEVIRFYPQEWSDVREIYHLRCNIMERFLQNAD